MQKLQEHHPAQIWCETMGGEKEIRRRRQEMVITLSGEKIHNYAETLHLQTTINQQICRISRHQDLLGQRIPHHQNL